MLHIANQTERLFDLIRMHGIDIVGLKVFPAVERQHENTWSEDYASFTIQFLGDGAPVQEIYLDYFKRAVAATYTKNITVSCIPSESGCSFEVYRV